MLREGLYLELLLGTYTLAIIVLAVVAEVFPSLKQLSMAAMAVLMLSLFVTSPFAAEFDRRRVSTHCHNGV